MSEDLVFGTRDKVHDFCKKKFDWQKGSGYQNGVFRNVNLEKSMC